MERLGTNYGGWVLPKDIKLNENSIVYSAGVGEDVSFDMILSDRYKCNIILIDPTNRAKKHFDEVKHYYENIKSNFNDDLKKDEAQQVLNDYKNGLGFKGLYKLYK